MNIDSAIRRHPWLVLVAVIVLLLGLGAAAGAVYAFVPLTEADPDQDR